MKTFIIIDLGGICLQKLHDCHQIVFKNPPTKWTYFAPGRINLIGEHLDYNGGVVFPAAIDKGTYAKVGLRNDRFVRAYSQNFEKEGIIEINLDRIHPKGNYQWADYLAGVFKVLQKEYKLPHGLDITLYGDLPNRSGLSSSASLEILLLYLANDIYQLNIDLETSAKMGQAVENEYLGIPSGIMDQFAVAFGKRDAALEIDTSDLSHVIHQSNLSKTKYTLAIINTNKPRELVDSKYQERKEESENALMILNHYYQESRNFLCDYSKDELFQAKEAFLSQETIFYRARHVITENERVGEAIKAFRKSDLQLFGQLMNESHHSLKNDYQVTGKELDTIVSIANHLDYLLGARMTGAGFGGCAIALLEKKQLKAFTEYMTNQYQKIIGYPPQIFEAHLSGGPQKFKG